MVSYERLPMLEIVFDRLVRLMTTSLRNFTSDNVEVCLSMTPEVRATISNYYKPLIMTGERHCIPRCHGRSQDLVIYLLENKINVQPFG